MTEKPEKSSSSDRLGIILIGLAVLGFIATCAISVWDHDLINNGTIPSISFLLMVVGIAFKFPTLLEERKGELSTMRVIVLIVVLVFAVIYIKLGWIAGTFEEFTIDKSWIYILGLAFGSKAFQRFAENDKTDSDE